jgi:hypothetical protein
MKMQLQRLFKSYAGNTFELVNISLAIKTAYDHIKDFETSVS